MTEDAQYWALRPKDDPRKDWRYPDGKTWTQEYWQSREHPHRKMIMEALESLYPFNSLIEVGCNAGPNLINIESRWPEIELCGVDINPVAIEEATGHLLPSTLLMCRDLKELPTNLQFDVLLADAVLMYVDDNDITKVMGDFNRIATNIVIVDWDHSSKEGSVVDFHWARNYKLLLEDHGFEVEKIKITEKEWPSKNWSTHGYVWIARR